MVIFITRRFEKKEKKIPIFILAEIRGFEIYIYVCMYTKFVREWKIGNLIVLILVGSGTRRKDRDGCEMVVKMARRNISFKCLLCIID